MNNPLNDTAEQAQLSMPDIYFGERFREDYDPEKMITLKTSLQLHGQIQPIAVMRLSEPQEGRNYRLIAGGRRYKALKELGKATILARIYPDTLKEEEYRMIELVENIHRDDLSTIEELKLKKRIHDLGTEIYGTSVPGPSESKGHTIEDTAKLFNESRTNTQRDLQLAALVEAYPELAEGVETKAELKKKIQGLQKRYETQQKLKAYAQEKEKSPDLDDKQRLQNCYLLGDSYKLIKQIPDKSIDLVDLDIDYPVDVESNPLHVRQEEDKATQTYQEVSKEDFPNQLLKAMQESYRVLKEDGWLICWFGYEYFEQVQVLLKKAGFRTSYLHGKWYKGLGYAHTRNAEVTLGHTIEPFFYAKKGSPKLNKPRADVFEFKLISPKRRKHPYAKPIKLWMELLQTFCTPGSSILSFFGGSGNTNLAAANRNMHAICFDTGKAYKESYNLHVQEQKFKSYVDLQGD